MRKRRVINSSSMKQNAVISDGLDPQGDVLNYATIFTRELEDFLVHPKLAPGR